MPERMSEDMPDRMSERVCEDMPERMPERTSEELSEDMPERMSERPQPPAPDGSVPCMGLNCEFRMAVFPAGPQPRVR